MSLDRTTRLFFDASCLIAAAGSPTGGSGFLLSLCQSGFLLPVLSHPVLLEVERNITENLPAAALARHRRNLLATPFVLAPVPLLNQDTPERKIAGEKDEHVLAAAVAGNCPYLLTLDKRLTSRINNAGLSLRALSPGEFIAQVLPEHPDYAKLRG